MANYMSKDNFRDYFLLKGFPYWWAYESSTTPIDRFTISQDDKEEMTQEDLLEYSWLQIEELFDRYPGGAKINFRVAKNASDGKDRCLFPKVKWGNPMAISGTSRTPQSPQMMGGNWQLFQMMMELQKSNFSTQLQSERSLQEVQFENLLLKQALEGAEQPDPQLEVVREIAGLAKMGIQKWLTPTPQNAALGTLGQKEEKAQDNPGEKAPEANQPISFDAVMADCNVIAQTLPEYHLNHITRALAIFVQQNPEQAKLFLGPLIQQLQNA